MNLPAPTTAFVGRDDELARISALLSDPACRLLTLVGPGGIGKTRLAVEAMGQLSTVKGIHLILLQPLTSPDSIVFAIAEVLDFQFYASAEPKQQILGYLRDKSWLLVLDNFEHLLDGVTLLSEILAAAPGVRMLATSRERLNLREEWVLEIGGLNYPTNEVVTDIESYSAVELFMQYARRVRVGFKPTAAQRPAIVRVCRLVDGMPLALELAASWVRALSCEAIADEIERSLDILETPTRNVEPRHRTMRAALDQSWHLLSESERDVFMKLSVFQGGFTREAAAQVAGASLRTLTALVDKSLLRVDGNGRYDIHELLRQYGEERLNQSPEEHDRVLGLHSAYFADFLHDQPMRYRIGLDAVQGEIGNVRAALGYMVGQRQVADLRTCLKYLSRFYNERPRPYEGIEFFRQVADALQPFASDRETALVLGAALAYQAHLHIQTGTPAKGLPIAEESLHILRPLDSLYNLRYALLALAELTLHLNRLAETQAAAEEGVRLMREIDHAEWTGAFLFLLGNCLLLQGKYAQARQLGEEAFPLAEQTGSLGYKSMILSRLLGPAAYEMGDYAEAKRCFEQGLQIAEEMDPNETWHWAVAHKGLGDLALAREDFAEARWRYQQQTRIMVEAGYKQGDILLSLLSVGKLLRTEGEKEAAVEILTLIVEHPATIPLLQKQAKEERSPLEVELAPEVYAAAVERGRVRDLDATANEIIVGFSRGIGSEPAPPAADLLTTREREILRLIADGLSNSEIADRLVLATSTVKWYVNQIFGKLEVTTRTQAVARARKLGLLTKG